MRTNTTRARNHSGGFSLLELLISMAVGLVLLAGATRLFSDASRVSYLVAQRGEMQQNARAVINSMVRDLSLAGTGLPLGGIALPTGNGSSASKFNCDQTGTCYTAPNNNFPNQHFYAAIPGPTAGPIVTGRTTDVVTLAYTDTSLLLNQCPLAAITAPGDQITVGACMTNPPAGTPGFNDPAVGVKVGDVLMLQNANGAAVGTVTSVSANGNIGFANGDWLNINQSGAAAGSITKSLSNPGAPGTYPPLGTTAIRVLLITYFIQLPPGGAGPRMMRQVNAQSPVPIAENIENLQVFYDIFNDGTGAESSNLPGANNLPNQIRKVDAAVTARTALQQWQPGAGFQRITLATSVSPRNLSFHDRYQ
jgi:type IV pilus assembly protein PilW